MSATDVTSLKNDIKTVIDNLAITNLTVQVDRITPQDFSILPLVAIYQSGGNLENISGRIENTDMAYSGYVTITISLMSYDTVETSESVIIAFKDALLNDDKSWATNNGIDSVQNIEFLLDVISDAEKIVVQRDLILTLSLTERYP